MVIFLDCDWTIFDAQRFIDYMNAHENDITALLEKDPQAPLASWLYADVVDFCIAARGKGYKIVILSMARNIEGQIAKIRATGIAAYVDDIVVVPGEKSTAAGDWLKEHNERPNGHYFIDDAPLFLNDMKRTHPGIWCIRMERTALLPSQESIAAVDLSDRTITSLDELRGILGLEVYEEETAEHQSPPLA
ncbi:MAG TPA: hypothetical protein VJ579_00205 [Candidatus Paceibacterota bacterium]|nr:hypothetical protein [Candidatus Paceibacterota bacterium]